MHHSRRAVAVSPRSCRTTCTTTRCTSWQRPPRAPSQPSPRWAWQCTCSPYVAQMSNVQLNNFQHGRIGHSSLVLNHVDRYLFSWTPRNPFPSLASSPRSTRGTTTTSSTVSTCVEFGSHSCRDTQNTSYCCVPQGAEAQHCGANTTHVRVANSVCAHKHRSPYAPSLAALPALFRVRASTACPQAGAPTLWSCNPATCSGASTSAPAQRTCCSRCVHGIYAQPFRLITVDH